MGLKSGYVLSAARRLFGARADSVPQLLRKPFRVEPLEQRLLLSQTFGTVTFDGNSAQANLDLDAFFSKTNPAISFGGDIQVQGQQIAGQFSLSYDATGSVVTVSATQLNLSFVDASNNPIFTATQVANDPAATFTVTSAGITGDSGVFSVSTTVPNLGFSGNVSLDLDTVDTPKFVKVTGTGLSVTVGTQSITGNFTFQAASDGVSATFDTVDAKFGGGIVEDSGAGGSFAISSAGIVGDATSGTISTTTPGVTFEAGFALSVDTTGADKHFKISGTGVKVQVGSQELTGNFAVEEQTGADGTQVTMGADGVHLSLSGGLVTIDGASGGFVFTTAGLAGSASGTVSAHAGGLQVGGTYQLAVNTTGAAVTEDIDTSDGTFHLALTKGPYVEFQATDQASLSIGGQSIGGNFYFQEAKDAQNATVVKLGFTDANATIGDPTNYLLKADQGSGAFLITSAGVAGQASVSLSSTISGVTFGGTLSLVINTTGSATAVMDSVVVGSDTETIDVPAGSYIHAEATDLQVAGYDLPGTFVFEKQTVGGLTTVSIAATGVNVSLGGGLLTVDAASGVVVLQAGGLAAQVSGGLTFSAGDVSASADFLFQINRQSTAVSQQVSVGGQTVTLDLPAGPFVRVEGTGLSVNFGPFSVAGNFVFEDSTEDNASLVTIGLTNGTAFLGSGGVGVELGSTTNPLQGGILLRGGGVAFDLSGDVSLTNVPGVTFQGTSIEAKLNTTGADVTNQVIHVPDADNGPGTDVTLNVPIGLRSIGGHITLGITGFVSLDGDFLVQEQAPAAAGDPTQFLIGADGVTATLGTGTVGVSLNAASLGLLINKPASGPSTYALQASGGVSIQGISGLSLPANATISVEVNNTTTDLKDNGQSPVIQTPNGSVTLNFDNADNVQDFQASNLTLGITNFLNLKTDFLSFSRVQSGDGSQISVAATGVDAVLGTGTGNNAVGVEVSSGTLGILIETAPATGPPTYALVASGNASLVGVSGLGLNAGATLSVKVNTTGSDLKVNGHSPVIQTPDGPITLDFADGSALQDVEGSISLQVAGVVSLGGSFSFTRTANDNTTEIDASASRVTAFLGTGFGTPNPLGLDLSAGSLAVRLFPGTGKYAFYASGTGALDGFTGLLFNSTLTAAGNDTGGPATFDDPANAGHTVTITDGTKSFGGSMTIEVAGLVDLSGNFSFTQTASEVDAAATGVTAFAGTGAGTDNALGIGLKDGNLQVHLLSDAGKYALYASGGVDLKGIPNLTVTGSVTVQINNTGSPAHFDDPANPGQTLLVDDGTQSFSGGVQIAVQDSGGNTIVALGGNFGISQDSNHVVTISITSAQIAIDYNGSEIVGITGSATFTMDPTDGFKLSGTPTFSLSVGGTTLHGLSRLSSLAPADQTTPGTHKIGPLVFVNLKPTLNSFQFQNGQLSFNLGLSADSAGLDFTGSGGSDGQNPGGVTVTLDHPSGSFGLTVGLSPQPTVGLTGAFDFTANSLTFDVNNAVHGVFNTVHAHYDPSLDSTQTIVSIDSGSVTIPSLSNLTFSIKKVGNTPGLVITGQSFHFASATVTVTRDFTVGDLTISNPSVTLTNFGVNYTQGTFSFGNSSLTLSAGLNLSVGSATVSGTGLSVTLTFGQDGTPSGFSFHADTITASFGSYVTASASDVTITPTAMGTDPVLVVQNSVTAELKIGPLDVSGSASGFEVLANGQFAQLPGLPFTVSISVTPADAGDSGALGWPSWIPIQLQNLTLSWPDLAGDPGNIDITVSASVSGSLGPLTLSGSVTDLTINTKRLASAQFPITSVGSVTATASGSLFGGAGQVNLGVTFGIVRADAAGVLIPTTDHTTTAATIAMYVGLDGGFELENLSLRIQFAMSAIQNTDGSFSVFPLGVYFSFDSPEPLILDPDTGLALSGLRGGVQFNAPPLPQIDNPFDLLSPAFSPPAQLTGAQWHAQLEQQVINQLGGGGFIFSIPSDQAAKIASLDPTILDLFSQNGYDFGTTLPSITTVDPGNTWIISDAAGHQFLVDNGGNTSNNFLVSSLIASLPFDQTVADGLTNNSVPQPITDALTAANVMLPAGSTVQTLTANSRWLIQNGTSKYVVVKRASTFVITGGGGGTTSSLSGPIKIFAGATFTDAYAPDAVSGSVDLIIETDGAIVLNGALMLGGGQLTANARMFIDLRGLNGQNPQPGQTDPIRVVFLAQMPEAGTSALPPVFSLYGTLTVRFFDPNGQEISPSQFVTGDTLDLKLDHAGATLNAFNQQQLILGASLAASPTGAGLLELKLSPGNVHLTVDANVAMQGQLLSGNVAHGSGDLTLQVTTVNNAPHFDVWGALRIDVNLDNIQKLADLGVTVNGTFFLRLNTTAVAKSVTLQVLNDQNQVDPIDTSLPADSVELFVGGHVAFNQGPVHLDMGGVFDIAYSTATGFSLFLAVELKMDLAGTTIFEFQALGLLVVHNDGGLAMHLELDRSVNATSGDLQFSGSVALTLDLNTTQAPVDFELPPDLTKVISADLPADLLTRLQQNADNDGNYHVIISAGPPLQNGGFGSPAVYFVAQGTADLNLLNQITVSGSMYIEVTSSLFTLTVDGNVNLTPLGTLHAFGTLTITSAGVLAAINIDLNGGFGGGASLAITGNFRLLLNTTGSPHSFDVPNADGSSTVPVNTSPYSVSVHVEGSISFSTFATGSGSLDIDYSGGNLTIAGTLTFSLVDAINFSATLDATVYNDGFNGVAAAVDVSLNSGINVANIFTLNVTGSAHLTINTTAKDRPGPNNTTIPADSFHLDITGGVNLLGVLTLSGEIIVNVNNGGWSVSVPQNHQLSLDFFNIVSVNAYGFFNSKGAFYIDVNGFIQIGTDSFGVRGSGDVQVYNAANGALTASPGALNVTGSFEVTGTLFGISVDTNIDFQYDGGTGRIHVDIDVSVVIHIHIHTIFGNLDKDIGGSVYTAHFTIGYLIQPPPVHLGEVDNGVLVLYVGNLASNRGFDTSETDESVELSGGSFDGTSETITVQMMGQTQTFTGVRSISALMGSGNDYAQIDSSVAVPVTVDAGTGDNTVIDNGTASGTLSAAGGSNRLIGGPAADTFNAGAGSFQIIGNGGGDTINITTTGNSGSAYAVTESGGGLNRLFVNGTTGADQVQLDIGTDSSNGSVTVGDPNALDTGGLHIADAVSLTGVSQLTLDTLGGRDTFNVRGLVTPTVLNPGTGPSTVNLGSAAPAGGGILSGLQAALTINGSNTTLNVDDTGDASAATGMLSATQLTGLGTAGITYSGLSSITLSLGSGGNSFTIASTPAGVPVILNTGAGSNNSVTIQSDQSPTTVNAQGSGDTINVLTTGATTTINTPAGRNTINVGSLAPTTGGTLAGIAASVVLNGNNLDVLNLDDTGSPVGKTIALDATRVTGAAPADVVFNGLAALNVSLGFGGNSVTINATGNLTTTTLNAGAGGDAVTLVSDSGPTFINTGAGNDTVNVRATSAATTINTASGADVINIGSASPSQILGTVSGVQGALIVNGDDNDTMNVDDTGDAAPATLTLLPTLITGPGMGSAGITYSRLAFLNINLGAAGNAVQINGTAPLTHTAVNTGSGNDTADITATGGPTTVNTGGGANTIEVGSAAPAPNGGKLDFIAGALNLVGSGPDSLLVDDTASSAGKTGTLTSSTLTGLGMAGGITYSGMATLNINLGSGGNTFLIAGTGNVTNLNSGAGVDTVSVLSTSAPTTINTGGATNVVNVASRSPASGGILNQIQAPLFVVGSGPDTLNVDDTGSTAAKSGTLTPTTLTGLGMGAAITYGQIAQLNLTLGSGGNTLLVVDTDPAASTFVNSGTGGDAVNIEAVTGPLTVNTGGGSNVNSVNVGSLAPATGGIVDHVQGALIVAGNGADTLNVDDTGSAVSKTGFLTPTTLTGLAMGPAGITYGGLAHLNINLGPGGAVHAALVGRTLTLVPPGNTFNILNTAAATTTFVNTGTGTDVVNVRATGGPTFVNTGGDANANVVNVGSLAPATGGIIDGINGPLAIVGGGNDVTNVDDTASTAPKTSALTPNTLGGLNMGATITYSGLATLNVHLGSGGNVFDINDINPLTHTVVDGGPSASDVVNATFAGDFNGRLDLTSFDHGTIAVNHNFNGTLTDTAPGHLESVVVNGSITPTGLLLAGSIDALTIGQDLAGTVQVQQTLGSLTIVNGSFTPTGVLQAANLNSFNLGPNHLSVGQNLAGTLSVSGTLGSVRVAGGTPGVITAGRVGTVAVFGGFGPDVLRIIENGIERRVELAVPSNPYPTWNPASVAGNSYVNVQYFYESGALPNPQLTARITNNVGAAADQYDLSLITYNDVAKFNLARLDAAGVAGVRNVAVEGDLLSGVTAQAAAFFTLAAGGIDLTPAGVRLPLDNLAAVAVRDFVPNSSVQARSIQGIAFGSHAESGLPWTETGAASDAADAQALLAPGTAIVQASDTFRIPFADLPAQQVAFFFCTDPVGGHFDQASINFTVQGRLTPNAAGTANGVTPSNVARGAVTALVSVTVPYYRGRPLASVVQSIRLRGDGASIRTEQWIAASINSTGPLGDLTLLADQGITDVTAPSIFGSIIADGPITGTVQTTGLRMDPITNAVTQVSADLGNVYVAYLHGVPYLPYLTSTVIQSEGGLAGRIISRGNLISAITSDGGISGTIASQGNLGAFVTAGGTTIRVGGVLSNGLVSGQLVVLGNAIGDITLHGGLKGGRVAVEGSILGNLLVDGGLDASAALVCDGAIGDPSSSTSFTISGANKGVIAAKGRITFAGGTPGGAVFNNAGATPGNANAAAVDAIFTDHGQQLLVDLKSLDLQGLQLILQDLAAIHVGAAGTLTGVMV